MTNPETQKYIDDFYDNEVRRSIRVSTNQKFNRTENKNKGVAMAAPKKEK